uniref:Uncharacterized protein n=1 Tax=Physcomitrium patens TaxID=3218 RepID=A0A7I4AR81_PHYPA
MILRPVEGDVHEDVEGHNKLLQAMRNATDVSISLMAGTMDRFTKVFKIK